MGLLDIFKKKDNVGEGEETPEEEENVCALCGKPIKKGEGKKYGGQWWHKSCLRKARKMARGMI